MNIRQTASQFLYKLAFHVHPSTNQSFGNLPQKTKVLETPEQINQCLSLVSDLVQLASSIDTERQSGRWDTTEDLIKAVIGTTQAIEMALGKADTSSKQKRNLLPAVRTPTRGLVGSASALSSLDAAKVPSTDGPAIPLFAGAPVDMSHCHPQTLVAMMGKYYGPLASRCTRQELMQLFDKARAVGEKQLDGAIDEFHRRSQSISHNGHYSKKHEL